MANKRRSMAEFLSQADQEALTVTDGLKRDLPIESIFPRPNQPRRIIDSTELEHMAETVKALGIIQPIVVRPKTADQTGRYEIVAGERRWRAAQLAGMSIIPAVIRQLDDQRITVYSLAENVARSDLNPIELAKGYHRVVEESGFTQTELAEAIGQNIKTVNRILQLLRLPDSIQDFIEQGSLSAKHGELLLGAPRARQVELAQLAIQYQWSVRELERHIAKPLQDAKRKSIADQTDANIAREQLLWSEQLGTDVKLQHCKTGKVRIVITVASLDEYQGIRDRLGVNF